MLKLNVKSPQNDSEPFLNHNDPIELGPTQFIKNDDGEWNFQPEVIPRMHSLLYFGQEIQPDGGTSVTNTDFKENSSRLKKHIFTNQYSDTTYVPRTTETISTFNSLPPSNVSSEIYDREYRDHLYNKPSKSFLNLEVQKLQNDLTFSHSENCNLSSIYSNTTVLEKNSTLCYNERSDYMKNELIQTQYINLSNNLVDLNYSQEISCDTELVKYEENNDLFRRDIYLQDLGFVNKESIEMATVSLNSYCCNKCQPPNLKLETKLTTEFRPDTTKLSTFRHTIDSLPWDATNEASTNLLKTSNNNIYNGRATMRDDVYQANPHSQNHTIPEGDDFVQMFQRRQIPDFELRFFENKSIFARNTTLDSRGVGFDVAMLINSNEQFQSEQDAIEARKTESEILSMYPLQNRNYQRRY